MRCGRQFCRSHRAGINDLDGERFLAELGLSPGTSCHQCVVPASQYRARYAEEEKQRAADRSAELKALALKALGALNAAGRPGSRRVDYRHMRQVQRWW